MTEFVYAYLPRCLKFFVCSISIDGPNVLHRLHLFVIFSRREAVVVAIRVGSSMISFKENVWHNSLYLDIKGQFKFLKISDWFSLEQTCHLQGD